MMLRIQGTYQGHVSRAVVNLDWNQVQVKPLGCHRDTIPHLSPLSLAFIFSRGLLTLSVLNVIARNICSSPGCGGCKALHPKNVEKTTVCELELDEPKSMQFKQAIENNYWFELFMVTLKTVQEPVPTISEAVLEFQKSNFLVFDA
ncbi:hypothetical protein L6452_09207 [Arctium lappa]|uniref:Uncharacterized protein n=1 Tax=Arctium lappa TaxID=4217 RepID=A0ACB9DJP3_ARCLA|nr:hypothetical protein L6452_09207 [Arctium lappa]